jgi:hypothetical protein
MQRRGMRRGANKRQGIHLLPTLPQADENKSTTADRAEALPPLLPMVQERIYHHKGIKRKPEPRASAITYTGGYTGSFCFPKKGDFYGQSAAGV